MSGGARGDITRKQRAVYFFLLAAACQINQHLASSQRYKENLNVSGCGHHDTVHTISPIAT
jgi:hypothetical protein